MLPSKNLLFPCNFNPAFTPSNESALGLYQSSTATSSNKVKHFKNQDEVLKAYETGELNLGDKVILP
jgi:hypothetical protein